MEKIIDSIWERYKSEEYKKDVLEFWTKQAYDIDLKHIEATLKWVKLLFPDAPEALIVAAVGHDIDRAWPKEMVKFEKISEDDRENQEEFRVFKLKHARNSFNLLMKHHFLDETSKEFQLDVRFLVYNHETGSLRDSDSNLIKVKDFSSESYDLNKAAQVLTDANHLATLKDNLPDYLKFQGKDMTKKKILSMWNYISNETKDKVFSGEINLNSEIMELVKEVSSSN